MSSVSDLVVSSIISGVMPAVLSVLGLIVTLVFSVWGVLKVYALLTGADSSSVAYKMGRIFGAEIYDKEYEKYELS